MKASDVWDLLLLGALWGGSYLFMRFAVPAFGAAPLIWVRVAIASVCLIPLLVARGQWTVLRQHAGPIAFMGLCNTALPFVLIAWAMWSITAGFASILNAAAPIFAACVAAVWLREGLGASRAVGLAAGFGGVAFLAADKADFRPGGSGWAIVAMLAATFLYGFSANYAKRRLAGIPALANAAGSQLASAVILLPFAFFYWPERSPSGAAWIAALALGVACTGVAYLLYFRLIANVGPARAVTVTFLVPLFGILWGMLFLGERLDWRMVLSGAVILAGTGMATGLLKLPARLTPKGPAP